MRNELNRKIGGVDFGAAWMMSGLANFRPPKDGDCGYRHHRLLKLFGGYRRGMSRLTFVAKTTTLNWREGNMPLDPQTWQPKEFFPRCIYCGPWQFLNGVMLNAVSLSGPGAETLFRFAGWDELTEPFFLSFMSVAASEKERREEFRRYAVMLAKYSQGFRAPFGLQINLSCPNVREDLTKRHLADEAGEIISVARTEGVICPILFKIGIASTSPTEASSILFDSGCDGLCLTNTIPFGLTGNFGLPEGVWRRYFRRGESPLIRRGFQQAGGLSGRPLFESVLRYVGELRCHTMGYLNVGGGIMSARDVKKVHEAGANSISLGTVANLRPWRLERIVTTADQLFRQ